MLIHLAHFYQNANGVKIQAGVYDVNDKALNGLGKYLIQTEIATVVPVVQAYSDPEPETDTTATGDIEIEVVEPINFSANALKLIEDTPDIDLEAVTAHFDALEQHTVNKGHVQAYIDSLTD